MSQTQGNPSFKNQDNAVIWGEVKHVGETLERIERSLKELNGRLRRTEETVTRHDERWKGHRNEHKKLASKNENIASLIVAGIMAGIAALSGGVNR